MKKKNVLASVLLVGALFLSACGGSASTSTSASGVSGSFTSTAKGMGDVSVTLTLTDNVITDCTATGETVSYDADVVVIGAGTVDMDQIQIHPTVEANTAALITEGLRGDGAILVNANGERFIDEVGTRDVVSAAEIAQPGSFSWLMLPASFRATSRRATPSPALPMRNWLRSWRSTPPPLPRPWRSGTATLRPRTTPTLAAPALPTP